ncbi:MAG TPA: glycosyltransferase family 39 protein, partial [Thermoanaerobaculia bacterium]|nr:glycosyltransferase family 39 protein [Thermoanaerobaculia bacterium]
MSRRAVVLLVVLGAFLLGSLFRLWNLGPQVMSDDELHAVRAALGHPVSEILVTYQRTDNTIPLTAIYRVLLDLGVKLSEWQVRLPIVISGLLLLAVAPLWAARRLGWRTATVFAFLLAISPGLVFYSRIARSYAPIVLFGFGALAAFDAWWRKPDWRTGAAYVVLAALAAWFHLGAAPFVVSPFLFAGVDALIRRDRRGFLRLMVLGVATVLAFLAFLVPAWGSLTALVQEKHGELHLTWEMVRDLGLLIAGSRLGWVAVLFGIAAAAGLANLFRTDRRLAFLTVTAVLGHIAGLLYLAPIGHEHPLIAFRYVLVVLPWVLLWVARAPLKPVLAPLFLALLLWAGPFLDLRLWRSSFSHHNDYMTFMWPRPEVGPRQVPDFYRTLADSKEPGAVLEYPWMAVWKVNRAFYLYQEVHGRQVVVAPARALLADERLGFRNMVPGNPEGFLASRARWLVVHRNLTQEEMKIPPIIQLDERFRSLFRTFGHNMVVQLYQAWGKPDYSDRRIAVWDLDRVRTPHPLAPSPIA